MKKPDIITALSYLGIGGFLIFLLFLAFPAFIFILIVCWIFFAFLLPKTKKLSFWRVFSIVPSVGISAWANRGFEGFPYYLLFLFILCIFPAFFIWIFVDSWNEFHD